MSSSATALAAARLGYLGHESRQLEYLLGALGWGEVQVVPSQGRLLRLPVRRPVSGALLGFHDTQGTTNLALDRAIGPLWVHQALATSGGPRSGFAGSRRVAPRPSRAIAATAATAIFKASICDCE